MKYWVGVASLDHVKAGVAGGFCQLGHGKHSAVARLSPGDRIVYYSPKTEMGAGDPVQSFTAIGEVLPGEVYMGNMGSGFVPARRDVRFFEASDAPIRPLLDNWIADLGGIAAALAPVLVERFRRRFAPLAPMPEE